MDSIFSCHNQSSIARCGQHRLVYLVQDTTEVDLTKPRQPVLGAGPLGTDKRQGFFYHPLYAMAGNGLPLGVVDQVVWTRDPQSLAISSQERVTERKRACIEEKESRRWLDLMQSGEQIARSVPQTRFVMVADSEADIGELFCEAAELPDNYGFIIRQSHPHSIVDAVDSATGQELSAANVDEVLSLAAWRGERVVSIGGRDVPVLPDDQKRVRKQARTAREAMLSFRAVTVTIAGPRRPGGGSLEDAQLNVVEVLEQSPPEGDEPVRWVLLTTLPVGTVDELIVVLDGYCQRWGIELYFKTLKSGLKIEDMKYETLTRYLVAFSMLTVVGWRVEYLKSTTRSDPDSSCDKYFQTHEWMAVEAFRRRPAHPEKPPRMREFMISIAELGGYIHKSSQGDPGSKTIWRGLARFEIIVQAFDAFRESTCGV